MRMGTLSVVVVVVSWIAWGCGGAATERPSPRAEGARQVVEEYDEAVGRKDREALRNLMGSGFVYFTSSGAVRSRAEFIDFLTSAAYQPESRERSEIEVHLHGTTAVVASRWQGRGTYAGTPFDDDQRCSLVVGRVSGEWKLLSEHCTPIR